MNTHTVLFCMFYRKPQFWSWSTPRPFRRKSAHLSVQKSHPRLELPDLLLSLRSHTRIEVRRSYPTFCTNSPLKMAQTVSAVPNNE